jgi:peroxiredoxin
LELFRGKTALGREWSEWSRRWRESPEGRDYQDSRVSVSVPLAPDGSFRIEDVPADEYRLTIRVNEENAFRETGPFARLGRDVRVPAAPGGRSDLPLELGVFTLRPKSSLRAGDPAPEFEVTTVDGKALVVPRDFRGKVLLLDFGTMWDMQSGIQVTRLNDVHQKYRDDEGFAILSLLSAADNAGSRKFIEEKGEAWPQAIIGPLTNPMAAAYGVHDGNVPAAILIGPDGKVIARDLSYQKIGEAVGQALKEADR